MENDLTSRILRDPNYQALKSKRSRFGWWLAAAMMVVYYGFILLVAFDKPFLATRLGERRHDDRHADRARASSFSRSSSPASMCAAPMASTTR